MESIGVITVPLFSFFVDIRFYLDINKSAHTGNFQYLLVDSVTVINATCRDVFALFKQQVIKIRD